MDRPARAGSRTRANPLPRANVQADGLNPHGSGGYIVVHEKPHGDFVLDFDYKLSKGCNSGVFLRVGDLKDPVMTGLEIALDDTTGTGMHDPGAFYDLVAPRVNAQKPAGEWNHMTITAKGPRIDIVLNGEKVSAIDLSQWPEAGLRPDGYQTQVHQGRDQGHEPPRLPGIPGPRQGLLVQERQAQGPRLRVAELPGGDAEESSAGRRALMAAPWPLSGARSTQIAEDGFGFWGNFGKILSSHYRAGAMDRAAALESQEIDFSWRTSS